MTTPGAEPAPTVDTMNHDDPEDQIAAQAEVFDEALISGEVLSETQCQKHKSNAARSRPRTAN